jgi:chemotaxis protein methyltransferase WspC
VTDSSSSASSATLPRVKQWLAERAGLEPELLQRDWLNRLIEERLRQLEITTEDSYCQLLDRDPVERDRIIREVSVGETYFFRYPASFDLLVQHVRSLRERLGGRAELRMLSVACASGEEPYSMAIAAVHAGWPSDAVTVDAIDRNTDTLAVARQGQYPLHRKRQQIPSWASPWLHHRQGRICVAAPIKSAVHFLCADAVAAPASLLPGRYAVVFCRNLLIYLHTGARSRLVDRLADWLEPDGLLFVGHAEQLQSLRSRFQVVPQPGTFALRRLEAARAEDVGRPAIEEAANDPAQASAKTASRGSQTRSHGDGSRPRPAFPTPAEQQRTTTGSSPDLSLVERARRAADRGDLDDALTAIGAALQAGPPTAELYQLLGSIQLSRECFPEARDALRRAVYLDPDHEESLLQLAIVYQRLGDDSHAARYRKRAARTHQRKAGGPRP